MQVMTESGFAGGEFMSLSDGGRILLSLARELGPASPVIGAEPVSTPSTAIVPAAHALVKPPCAFCEWVKTHREALAIGAMFLLAGGFAWWALGKSAAIGVAAAL